MKPYHKAPEPRPCFCCGKPTYNRTNLTVKPDKHRPKRKQIAVCSLKCEYSIREVEPQIDFAMLKKIGRLRKHTRKRLRNRNNKMEEIPQLPLIKLLLRYSRCEYCDEPIKRGDATFDHIEPLSKEGGHKLSNIAIACSTCNSLKGSSLRELMEHGHSLHFAKLREKRLASQVI